MAQDQIEWQIEWQNRACGCLSQACERWCGLVFFLVTYLTSAYGTLRGSMVRRRSTVRFRKGAPVHGAFSSVKPVTIASRSAPPDAPGIALLAPVMAVTRGFTRQSRTGERFRSGIRHKSQPAQLRGGGRVAGHGMAEGSRRQVCTEPRLVPSLAHGAHQGSCADEA